jgi:hypothetical protein
MEANDVKIGASVAVDVVEGHMLVLAAFGEPGLGWSSVPTHVEPFFLKKVLLTDVPDAAIAIRRLIVLSPLTQSSRTLIETTFGCEFEVSDRVE